MASRDLLHLLVSMFSESELRIWLGTHNEYRAVLPVISEGLPAIQLAFDALEALERRGLLDRRFFDELKADFPHRAEDIDGVYRNWRRDSVAATRSRVLWVTTASLGVAFGTGLVAGWTVALGTLAVGVVLGIAVANGSRWLPKWLQMPLSLGSVLVTGMAVGIAVLFGTRPDSEVLTRGVTASLGERGSDPVAPRVAHPQPHGGETPDSLFEGGARERSLDSLVFRHPLEDGTARIGYPPASGDGWDGLDLGEPRLYCTRSHKSASCVEERAASESPDEFAVTVASTVAQVEFSCSTDAIELGAGFVGPYCDHRIPPNYVGAKLVAECKLTNNGRYALLVAEKVDGLSSTIGGHFASPVSELVLPGETEPVCAYLGEIGEGVVSVQAEMAVAVYPYSVGTPALVLRDDAHWSRSAR